MNKVILGLLATLVVAPSLKAGHGGDAVAAGLGGVMVGTLIGSAAASDSKHSRRAEEEARRAQDQTEQLRREQQQEKLQQIQREMDKKETEMKAQLEQQKLIAQQKESAAGSTTVYLLIGFIMLLLAGLAALGFVVLRKRDGNH